MEITIDRVHAGPPDSGNGGWVSGSLAAHVPTSPDAPAVRVRLQSPPPLERPLRVATEEDAPGGTSATALLDGEHVVARAWAAARPEVTLTAPVDPADAAAAEARYEGASDHPFPTCFSCGTERSPQEALCLRPGPLADGSERYATRWVPRSSEPELVWAALDCPGGWSAGIAGRPMVLGEMTCVVDSLPEVGVEHVVVAWQTGAEGRKHHSASVLQSAGGDVLAVATATWIAVDPASVRPKEQQ